MRIREIENRLTECANVREACVLPGPVFAGRMRYHAFVVLGKGTPAVREHFQAHCNVRLKELRATLDMQVVDRIPRTAAGVVSRRALATLTTVST